MNQRCRVIVKPLRHHTGEIVGWQVFSPIGDRIAVWADRIEALNWARNVAVHWAYELEFVRIVRAETAAAHQRMIGDDQ